MKFLTVAVVFHLIFCQLAFASVFYVDKDGVGGPCDDTSPGTMAAAPWCTIAKANHTAKTWRCGKYKGRCLRRSHCA